MALATRMYVCESADHPSSLLLGLNEQRLKGTLCDITVRVQGHLFKAHVNVLASAMGYFRDLFCKATKDKHEGVIDIPMIVNSTGFAKVLDFVYTSQLCLSQSTVMQVLCSACYLQIPYVVEKCQEFITTHGHVTPPSSLSAVTAPLLHGLRRNSNYSTAGPPPQSASASLTLLSQLNRASDLSRPRTLPASESAPKQQKHSPTRQDTDEQQECELINTPPSPDDRSNGEERTSGSPDAADCSGPRHHENTGKQSDMKSENLSGHHGDDFIPETNGLRDYNQDDAEREQIDHNSLALYFREKDHWTETERPLVPYYTSQDGAFTDQIPMTHGGSRLPEPGVFSASHMSMLAKKEKPKKEYKCEYCSKMFGRQQHLKRHILTHTGERPYPCQYCEKRFRRSEHLKHHLVSHEQQQHSTVTGFTLPPAKKKQRRADDAVSLSKMMLSSSYNQMNGIDRNSGPTGPVILPSMYTGIDRKSPILQAVPLKQEFAAVESNADASQGDREVAANASEEPPPFLTALNLSRAHPKAERTEPDAASPPDVDHMTNGESERTPDDAAAEENVIPSPKSEVDPNAVSGMENLNESASIIGMEGSEMLSSDLKQLIAAMDD